MTCEDDKTSLASYLGMSDNDYDDDDDIADDDDNGESE